MTIKEERLKTIGQFIGHKKVLSFEKIVQSVSVLDVNYFVRFASIILSGFPKMLRQENQSFLMVSIFEPCTHQNIL